MTSQETLKHQIFIISLKYSAERERGGVGEKFIYILFDGHEYNGEFITFLNGGGGGCVC